MESTRVLVAVVKSMVISALLLWQFLLYEALLQRRLLFWDVRDSLVLVLLPQPEFLVRFSLPLLPTGSFILGSSSLLHSFLDPPYLLSIVLPSFLQVLPPLLADLMVLLTRISELPAR